MSNNKLLNAIQEKPINLVYIAGGLIMLFFVSKKVIELFKIDHLKKAQRKASQSINKNNLTYTDEFYEKQASILFAAMNGAGTNYTAVKNSLSLLKTKDDFNKLYVAYGVRKSTVAWGFGQDPQDLMQWLLEDLSNSQMNEVRQMLKKIDVVI
jgi:Icc-related predicted phosphoesterase